MMRINTRHYELPDGLFAFKQYENSSIVLLKLYPSPIIGFLGGKVSSYNHKIVLQHNNLEVTKTGVLFFDRMKGDFVHLNDDDEHILYNHCFESSGMIPIVEYSNEDKVVYFLGSNYYKYVFKIVDLTDRTTIKRYEMGFLPLYAKHGVILQISGNRTAVKRVYFDEDTLEARYEFLPKYPFKVIKSNSSLDFIIVDNYFLYDFEKKSCEFKLFYESDTPIIDAWMNYKDKSIIVISKSDEYIIRKIKNNKIEKERAFKLNFPIEITNLRSNWLEFKSICFAKPNIGIITIYLKDPDLIFEYDFSNLESFISRIYF